MQPDHEDEILMNLYARQVVALIYEEITIILVRRLRNVRLTHQRFSDASLSVLGQR